MKVHFLIPNTSFYMQNESGFMSEELTLLVANLPENKLKLPDNPWYIQIVVGLGGDMCLDNQFSKKAVISEMNSYSILERLLQQTWSFETEPEKDSNIPPEIIYNYE